MPSPDYTLCALKKNVTKMVGCCIALVLTTKPMITFWFGEAELIELATLQISHSSH